MAAAAPHAGSPARRDPPSSTYRLQVRPSFDLHAAADICDYLATLGVGAVYLSPLLPSVRGSEHGYDVVAFDRIDPARGGLDGWTRLLAAARSRGLGVVVDIVPNHTGIAVPKQNAAWWDVLRLGPASRYAHWFDIDWTRGRILVPVLGDDFEPAQLIVDGDELCYFEHRFPLAPGTGLSAARPPESAADVHDRQHYELIGYRRGDAELNYRRFFAVPTLAGLRVEDEDVYAATHAQIASWLRPGTDPANGAALPVASGSGGIDGLRVDHPDGLADPFGYLTRLRETAGPDAWLTVEKILEPGEELPDSWPVDGTTGYDALAEVCALFVDPATESELDAGYRALTGDTMSFAEHVAAGKRQVAGTILAAELNRLVALVPDVPDAREALTELVVAFAVYRSYLPEHASHLAAAIENARRARPDLADPIGRLATRLADPADELCTRFQQLSGAVMAKGVEDTAYYRYTRFVAANEVGGNPERISLPTARFHEAQARRQRAASRSMTTLGTHDTKRGEDVRARLAVLAELTPDWTRLAEQLMTIAPLPDRPFAYLLWQTFAGAGFVEPERMHAYAEKAMREAATSTSWAEPNEAFERAVHQVIGRAYDDPAVHEPLAAFVERITPYGWTNSLGQKIVQLTMPGVPDVYQGTARWDDSLVDPDNRRPVNFTAARAELDRLDADVHAPPIDASGAAKLWVVSRALRLRRNWPELFVHYRPMNAEGPAADHAVVFDRGGAITVATRLPVALERSGGWGDTVVDVGRRVTDAIGGRTYRGPIRLAELLAEYPVALLVR